MCSRCDADGTDFLQIFDLFRAYDESAALFNAINGDVIAINAANVLRKRLFKVKVASK